MQQLETHLGNVKQSVQKGKDLEKHKMSPKFISKDVTELETNWEDVYKAATEKLTVLKVNIFFLLHSWNFLICFWQISFCGTPLF